ncbi:DUF975 family protein [Heyndrickxia acidicola]|uniref:DUF975 family protein n=1 Tax=Heyndrickxia acidicola TaxID=209389 RepID=A0ABU6MJW5_9BACI|nr:DUF975 family protein [Heyndrickxia acidicola]MED1204584.1 DUF975 family protein [Heyndrickxia acidicola]
MQIKIIKREARQILRGNWGPAILVALLTYVLSEGVPFAIEQFIGGNDSTQGQLFNFFVSILLSPLTIGCTWSFLYLARSGSASFEQIFSPSAEFKDYLKSLGLYLLVYIYSFLWYLLLIVPGIIKSIAYSQSYYLYKDHPDYTPNQLITESRRIMKGHKWTYFLLILSFIGWFILSLLTLGIGLIWLVPYVKTSLGVFYIKIKNSEVY